MPKKGKEQSKIVLDFSTKMWSLKLEFDPLSILAAWIFSLGLPATTPLINPNNDILAALVQGSLFLSGIVGISKLPTNSLSDFLS
ncbi:MAG TPA: hypothetical protein VK203_28115, partial [Nostocaceae cyanobacterium]|nr:hypothetical protein [Nostocaceae cyanobacterium]